MQDKYFTHDQFQSQVLDKRPPGADINDIINTFVSNGYTIQGVNEPKPQEPGFLDKLKSSVTSGIEGVKQADATYTKSNAENAPLSQQGTDALGVLGAVGKGITDVGGTVINAIPGVEPTLNAISSTAKSGLEAYDKNVIQPAGQAIRGAIGSENVDALAKKADPTAQAILDYVNQPNVKKNIESVKNIATGALTLAGAKTALEGGIGLTKMAGKGATSIGTSIQDGLEALSKSSDKAANEIKTGLAKGIKGEEIASQILTRQVRLTPSQRAEFARMSGGLDEGKYLVARGIYDTNEGTVKALGEDWLKSYNEKKQTLSQLPNQYTFNPANEAIKELVDYEAKTGVKGTKGLFTDKINQLAEAAKTRGLTVNEMDDLKNIYERTVALGYGKESNTIGVEKATRIDNSLGSFIEDKAEEQGFTNVRELNRRTQLSRYLADAIENRIGSRAGNNFVSLSDSIMATGAVVDPRALALLVVKKTLSSEAIQAKLAKMLGKTIPKDIKAEMNQSTPAMLNPKAPTKPDFFVAPEGAKAGQFESTTKQPIVTSGQKTTQAMPQEGGQLVNQSLSESIPQSTKAATKKVEKSIPKELQPLAEEARKYKSAEEFIKAQPKLYHGGGGEEIKIFEDRGKGGVWLSTEKKMAQIHANFIEWGSNGNKKAVMNEVVYQPKKVYKIKKGTDSFTGLDNDDLIEMPSQFPHKIDKIKSEGFDAIQSSDGKQLFVFDPSQIKTKFQLEDIWKKANKNVDIEPLIQEAKKYKSAEEFVKAQGTPVYHGTNKEFSSFDNKKLGSIQGFNESGFFFTDNLDKAKTYNADYIAKPKYKMTPEEIANNKNLKTVDVYIDNNGFISMADLENMYEKGLIKTKPDFSKSFRPESFFDNNRQAIKEAVAKGIKGIKHTAEGETVYMVADPSQIKTKQQLIDLWNKANGKK